MSATNDDPTRRTLMSDTAYRPILGRATGRESSEALLASRLAEFTSFRGSTQGRGAGATRWEEPTDEDGVPDQASVLSALRAPATSADSA